MPLDSGRANSRAQGLCPKVHSPPMGPQVWGLSQPAAEDTKPHHSLPAVPFSPSCP